MKHKFDNFDKLDYIIYATVICGYKQWIEEVPKQGYNT